MGILRGSSRPTESTEFRLTVFRRLDSLPDHVLNLLFDRSALDEGLQSCAYAFLEVWPSSPSKNDGQVADQVRDTRVVRCREPQPVPPAGTLVPALR